MYVICYYKPGRTAFFTKRPLDKTPAQLVAKRYRVALEASFYLTRPLGLRQIQLAIR